MNAKKSSGELDRRIKLHLTPAFGGRRLSAITTADLRAFTARRLEAGASVAEIKTFKGAWKVACKAAG